MGLFLALAQQHQGPVGAGVVALDKEEDINLVVVEQEEQDRRVLMLLLLG